MMNAREELLVQIAKCNVVQVAKSDKLHDCHDIVAMQLGSSFQVPEPWSGQIEKAPVLFISSNPSISEMEAYPNDSWNIEKVINFFQNRFEEPNGTASYLKPLLYSGARSKVVMYWAHARARTSEILESNRNAVRPGVDFALTEVVHCKSRAEIGVSNARTCCVNRYFQSVIDIAAAPVFIVYGKHAGNTVRERLNLEFLFPKLGKCMIEAKSKLVAFLPAPNSHGGSKTLVGNIGEDGLKQIRDHLRANLP